MDRRGGVLVTGRDGLQVHHDDGRAAVSQHGYPSPLGEGSVCEQRAQGREPSSGRTAPPGSGGRPLPIRLDL